MAAVRDAVRRVVWKTGKIVTTKAENSPRARGWSTATTSTTPSRSRTSRPTASWRSTGATRKARSRSSSRSRGPTWRRRSFGQLPLEGHPHAEIFRAAALDALDRLLLPSMEREVRRDLTDLAERHAVDVFARNLRSLLLQPPIPKQVVLAIDPGFRTGCKVAVLDGHGDLLEHGVIHPHPPQNRRYEAKLYLKDLVGKHEVGVVAIGNGTACRETEELVAEIIAEGTHFHQNPGAPVRRARDARRGRRPRPGRRSPRLRPPRPRSPARRPVPSPSRPPPTPEPLDRPSRPPPRRRARARDRARSPAETEAPRRVPDGRDAGRDAAADRRRGPRPGLDGGRPGDPAAPFLGRRGRVGRGRGAEEPTRSNPPRARATPPRKATPRPLRRPTPSPVGATSRRPRRRRPPPRSRDRRAPLRRRPSAADAAEPRPTPPDAEPPSLATDASAHAAAPSPEPSTPRRRAIRSVPATERSGREDDHSAGRAAGPLASSHGRDRRRPGLPGPSSPRARPSRIRPTPAWRSSPT